MICPLCQYPHISFYIEDKRRQFYQCERCTLVFVPRETLPSVEREKQEYDLHTNNEQDTGYVRFLSRAVDACLDVAPPHTHKKLLDFGCGPNPVLAKILTSKNYTTQYYDPIYYNDERPLLNQRYNVIVSTEAIEHFHTPSKEWALWLTLLEANGCIVIMTKRVISKERFSNWHYKNDMTHVSFFSESTFRWLANEYALELIIYSPDIVILKKRS